MQRVRSGRLQTRRRALRRPARSQDGASAPAPTSAHPDASMRPGPHNPSMPALSKLRRAQPPAHRRRLRRSRRMWPAAAPRPPLRLPRHAAHTQQSAHRGHTLKPIDLTAIQYCCPATASSHLLGSTCIVLNCAPTGWGVRSSHRWVVSHYTPGQPPIILKSSKLASRQEARHCTRSIRCKVVLQQLWSPDAKLAIESTWKDRKQEFWSVLVCERKDVDRPSCIPPLFLQA